MTVSDRPTTRSSPFGCVSLSTPAWLLLLIFQVALIMSNYENFRARNIARNRALLNEMQLGRRETDVPSKSLSKKRRKIKRVAQLPVRSSIRLASVVNRPWYTEENETSRPRKQQMHKNIAGPDPVAKAPIAPQLDVEGIQRG
jgi:hypothetical protein